MHNKCMASRALLFAALLVLASSQEAAAQSRAFMGAGAPAASAPSVGMLPLFPAGRVAVVPIVSYGYAYGYNAGYSYGSAPRFLSIQSPSRAPYVTGPGAFQP